MPTQGFDRRQFSRVQISIEADLFDGSLSVMACRTRDLSLQGVYVVTDLQFALGTNCDVVLLLRGMQVPLEVKIRAHVVRRQEDGVALQFDHLEGPDCWRHLSNLVRHNSEDPEKIMEEEDELAHTMRRHYQRDER
jgi:hypothetical protein